ncbi:MAG: hypothetical protein KF868_09450 [Acidobacteria bacterium]|nr:hypothetical protein [Acidobacteriota bacterium]MCW5971584.1 hypothetical protein [Blastocatellales bacterium]
MGQMGIVGYLDTAGIFDDLAVASIRDLLSVPMAGSTSGRRHDRKAINRHFSVITVKLLLGYHVEK